MSRLIYLGRNIKKYRLKKGFSQNQLAELVNLSREHLASIETGKAYISFRKLFLISDVLKVPVKDFVNFD
ncbi:MAG: helix-turn-helix domain-containing protein [Heliobacteriaceae bacterium]|jgi:transcriptional regulator with XRE-family HTH domain|nr:helix-turn-helix domain-containing protein [Heliobacteriaceae bacterium]